MAMGMSPFQCVYGYQPPLFPAQADKASCPSAAAYACRCRRTWTQAWANHLRAGAWHEVVANQHRTLAPGYRVGQRVWLSMQDLPLWGDSRKMPSRFVGPFLIIRVISRWAGQSDSSFPGQCTCTPPSMSLGLILPMRAPWSWIARPHHPRS